MGSLENAPPPLGDLRIAIHSLRHTMLTRLGESGVDAFAIMRIAGRSSITVSQCYVHPSPEAVERAFQRLLNHGNEAGVVQAKRLTGATFPATIEGEVTVSHRRALSSAVRAVDS